MSDTKENRTPFRPTPRQIAVSLTRVVLIHRLVEMGPPLEWSWDGFPGELLDLTAPDDEETDR